MVNRTAVSTGTARSDPLYDCFVRDQQLNNPDVLRAIPAPLYEESVQFLSLNHRAWEAVQNRSAGSVGPAQSLFDDADHQIIGDKGPAGYNWSGHLSELGHLGDRLAEHVTRGNMGNGKLSRKPLGLSSLAAPRRPDENDLHLVPGPLPAPPADASALHESVVMPHDQLRLDLLDGIHGHADHDEQRRATEVELEAHPLRDP